ncbi:MAG TPA: cupin domain-containing protein [Terracidiphilus sp.]|jgi:quercetin dioxygenase-like cupin family protein
MLSAHQFALHGLTVPDPAASITDPEPGLQRQVLVHTPAMMLVRHHMRKGWVGVAHHHPHEQLVYVVSGSLEITVNGVSITTSAGDNFIVASNAEHQATALEDSLVLDIFTPSRQDYL